MAPHLMRAQGAYKADKHARPTHAHTPTNTPPTHTHTHTPQKHKHSSHGFDGNRRKKARNQVFSFDLKEESDVACLTEKEREFQMTGPIY